MRAFEEYIEEGIMKKINPNTERAKSLLAEAQRRFSSLQERLDKIGIKDGNANDYVEYCYDLIMHLIRARLYLDGYYASGQGAHEAEVSYLQVLKFNEEEIQFIDQMRYFRNGILYYGTFLDGEYAEKVVHFTKKTYPKLKTLINPK